MFTKKENEFEVEHEFEVKIDFEVAVGDLFLDALEHPEKPTLSLCSLAGLGAATCAYLTEPSLTGLRGLFSAALIGAGTQTVAALAGVTGLLAAGFMGTALGKARGMGEENTLMKVGVLTAGLGAAAVAIPTGYELARDIVVNGTAPRSIEMKEGEKPAPKVQYHIPEQQQPAKSPAPQP